MHKDKDRIDVDDIGASGSIVVLPVGDVLVSGLQKEMVEAAAGKEIGRKKERFGLVAGVGKGPGIGFQIPERSLGLGKIKTTGPGISL